MLFGSLGLSSKLKEEEQKEEEENENKNKEEHKKDKFYCLQKRWKKGGGYIGVTLNINFSLTYMNLSLTYAYKEIKIT